MSKTVFGDIEIDTETYKEWQGGLHRWLRMIGHDGRSHHKQPSGGGSYYGGKAEF